MTDIARRFTYVPPSPGQAERYQAIRAAARSLAELIVSSCPDSRERDASLVRLDEVVMHANASIARNEGEGT